MSDSYISKQEFNYEIHTLREQLQEANATIERLQNTIHDVIKQMNTNISTLVKQLNELHQQVDRMSTI